MEVTGRDVGQEAVLCHDEIRNEGDSMLASREMKSFAVLCFVNHVTHAHTMLSKEIGVFICVDLLFAYWVTGPLFFINNLNVTIS